MQKRRALRQTNKNIAFQCCRVRAVVTVDERGQMVLPKDLRQELGIKAGEKLAVIAMGENKELCCLTLMKVDKLSAAIKITLGPVLNEITEINKPKR